MKEVLTIISRYNVQIILGLSASFIVLLLLNIMNQIKIRHITEKYNELVKGSDKDNIEELLFELGSKVENLGNKTEKVEENIEKLEDQFLSTIQKVDVLRYDAFEDMGSKQSFSAVLLDRRNSGMILTNIYGRDFSSSFVKPIEKGKSEYKLSKEEREILNKVMKQS